MTGISPPQPSIKKKKKKKLGGREKGGRPVTRHPPCRGCRMRRMRPRKKRERNIQEAVREALLARGFTLTEKTHGNSYQAGWPDLFCFRPPDLVRWVEMKRPGGKFTPKQVVRFTKWEKAGLGVWVLASSDDEELAKLFGPPNWRDWQ